MKEFLSWLGQNPWLNLVFLALAISSILISIALYLRSRKEKLPVFNMRHFNLVQGHLRKLERVRITYDGVEVKDLTLTRFALWNKGRDTINRSDVAPTDPLRLQVPTGCQILKAEIDFTQTIANNFSLRLSDDGNRVSIDFDYFHRNDGFTLTLYHTSKSTDVTLLGTIKGVSAIRRGVVEENDILYPVLDRTIGKLITAPRRRRLGKLWFMIFVLLASPIVLLIAPVELVMRLLKRSPPQFKLESA